MSPDEQLESTTQRSSWLTRDYGSPAIRRIAVVLLSAVTIVSLASVVYLFARPEPRNAYREAAELDTLIHGDPRFAAVSAICVGGRSVLILAPEAFSADARTALEQFVGEHATNPNTEIHYVDFHPKP